MNPTNSLKKWLAAAAVAACALTTGGQALADGLVVAPSDLSAKERATLQTAIAKAKAADPKAFEMVRNVEGYKPERYQKLRKAVPMVARELEHMGPRALMPMIEALAFDVWDQGTATDAEWRALKVGMLHAVGHARDARASSVLRASFDAARHPEVAEAAARGMGMVCDGGSLGELTASLKGDRRAFAVAGLGECFRKEATAALAAELDATTSAADAAAIGRALGRASSSWAWKTLGDSRVAEAREVREVASAAAARAFLRFSTRKTRSALTFTMTMAALPDLRAVVSPIRAKAPEVDQRALDRIVRRVERRTKRRR